MRRGKAGGKPIKSGRRKATPAKGSKAARPNKSAAIGDETEVARLRRELSEALEQQTATADVLKVISSSRGKLDSVFQTMLANAVRICEAKFGVLFSYRDSEFSPTAWVDVPPAYKENLKRSGSFHREKGSGAH
jgi:two-component system NtrC family sensor kinase